MQERVGRSHRYAVHGPVAGPTREGKLVQSQKKQPQGWQAVLDSSSDGVTSRRHFYIALELFLKYIYIGGFVFILEYINILSVFVKLRNF